MKTVSIKQSRTLKTAQRRFEAAQRELEQIKETTLKELIAEAQSLFERAKVAATAIQMGYAEAKWTPPWEMEVMKQLTFCIAFFVLRVVIIRSSCLLLTACTRYVAK
jgi:hypothetical protein